MKNEEGFIQLMVYTIDDEGCICLLFVLCAIPIHYRDKFRLLGCNVACVVGQTGWAGNVAIVVSSTYIYVLKKLCALPAPSMVENCFVC